jgi:hypothetical protein
MTSLRLPGRKTGHLVALPSQGAMANQGDEWLLKVAAHWCQLHLMSTTDENPDRSPSNLPEQTLLLLVGVVVVDKRNISRRYAQRA